MSRLDSFIRRLEAQRACLDLAAELVRDLPGPVLELGLGNGRTFDHLRALCPERAIFAFDRELRANPASTPDPARLVLGDIRATLPAARAWLPGPVALAHSDIGTGDVERNDRLARWLAGALPPLLADGAVVACDQPLDHRSLVPLPPPAGVRPGRYFLYRHRAGSEAA